SCPASLSRINTLATSSAIGILIRSPFNFLHCCCSDSIVLHFLSFARVEGLEPSSPVLETDLLAITINPHSILSFFFCLWCPVELNHDLRDFTPVHFYPLCQSTLRLP